MSGFELRGEGVLLRPWRSGDEEALARIADDCGVWRNMTNKFPSPYTRDDAAAWVARAGASPPVADGRNLAVVAEGAVAGGIGFARLPDLRTRTAEIGYWLGRDFWGRGLATAAVRLVADHALAEYDFVRLQASVIDWNPASARVLEKAGFTLEARHVRLGYKDGEVCDLLTYARFRPSR